MMRQHVRFGCGTPFKSLLQHTCNPGMELLPLAFEHAGVGCFSTNMCLKVYTASDPIPRRKISSAEINCRSASSISCSSFETIIASSSWKVPADDRGDLGYFFDRSKTIKT